MPLSIMNSNGGTSQGHLFKPARPIKTAADSPSTASGDQRATAQARPAGRSVIDSTGIGTAHIAAALTVYMSTLATSPSGSTDADTPDALPGLGPNAGFDRTRARSSTPKSSATSGAADLLRVLDAYAS